MVADTLEKDRRARKQSKSKNLVERSSFVPRRLGTSGFMTRNASYPRVDQLGFNRKNFKGSQYCGPELLILSWKCL
jgi:hypothetical protein